MLEYLKDVFSIVLILILSATIILNILDYIWVSLKLPLPFRIYRLSLDRPNLRYIVCPIQKSGFQNLAFLVLKHGPISEIPKMIIFINTIEDAIEMERYLRSKLPDCVHNGNQAFVVI